MALSTTRTSHHSNWYQYSSSFNVGGLDSVGKQLFLILKLDLVMFIMLNFLKALVLVQDQLVMMVEQFTVVL